MYGSIIDTYTPRECGCGSLVTLDAGADISVTDLASNSFSSFRHSVTQANFDETDFSGECIQSF